MKLLSVDGHNVLQLTAKEAGILRSLLCVASPRGEAEHGRLTVQIRGEAAPVPPEGHQPIEER